MPLNKKIKLILLTAMTMLCILGKINLIIKINATIVSGQPIINLKISIIKFIIGWPLTIVALIFIIRFILPNIQSIVIAVRSINFIFLFSGIFCTIAYLFIRSFFWKKMLSYKDISISWKEINWFWGASEIHRYIPGNIWSFLGRATHLSQKNISKSITFSLFLFEAEFIVVSSLFLSLFAINFFLYGLLPHFPYKPLCAILSIVMSLLFIFCFLGNQIIFKVCKVKQSLNIGKWKIKISILPLYSFKQNLTLFFIQTVAMFFFGLGTYFSISSITFLYPLYITTFIGFFVFSLCVGYLSFITPMGLGVREGIMTAGLIKFIPLSLAGFSSLFARIVFV